MRTLSFPKLLATLQMCTVQIPFRITLSNQDPLINQLRKYFTKQKRWWNSPTIKIPLFVRGIIRFYDTDHGYLDHGDFVNVPLTGRSFGWWRWARIEMYGTLPNIGRFCFSGWGICEMEVYDEANTSIMKGKGKVITQLVRSGFTC